MQREGTGRREEEEDEEEDEDEKEGNEVEEEENNGEISDMGRSWGVACVGDSAGTRERICGSLV